MASRVKRPDINKWMFKKGLLPRTPLPEDFMKEFTLTPFRLSNMLSDMFYLGVEAHRKKILKEKKSET